MKIEDKIQAINKRYKDNIIPFVQDPRKEHFSFKLNEFIDEKFHPSHKADMTMPSNLFWPINRAAGFEKVVLGHFAGRKGKVFIFHNDAVYVIPLETKKRVGIVKESLSRVWIEALSRVWIEVVREYIKKSNRSGQAPSVDSFLSSFQIEVIEPLQLVDCSNIMPDDIKDYCAHIDVKPVNGAIYATVELEKDKNAEIEPL